MATRGVFLIGKRKRPYANTIILACIIIILILVIYIGMRMPLLGDEWNKQTIYVGLADIWYGSSTDKRAHALWIDDDSGKGVFTVKCIADEMGIRAAFAVIADKMEPAVADSLASWQQQGFGIISHGLRHERWRDWNKSQIDHDIKESYRRLHEQGFDTTRILKIISPPHSCNTKAIRMAIKQQGCQMISGANLVNPDRHVFQLGCISITPRTDIESMRQLLQKAYQRKAFVIFSTHASVPAWFSEEKIKEVLKIAKEIGFVFDFYE